MMPCKMLLLGEQMECKVKCLRALKDTWAQLQPLEIMDVVVTPKIRDWFHSWIGSDPIVEEMSIVVYNNHEMPLETWHFNYCRLSEFEQGYADLASFLLEFVNSKCESHVILSDTLNK